MPAPKIGITPGEPAGIGPDVCLLAYREIAREAQLVLYTDPNLLQDRARLLGLDIEINTGSPEAITVQPVAGYATVKPGVPNPANASHVIASLDAALTACKTKDIDAIVTGPVNKALVNDGGISFTGHTEWFAQATGTPQPVMMLASGDFRVAVATTHIPLSQVPASITPELLTQTLRIMDADLRSKFGIEHPVISVCGLNPHAGEDGNLGQEEINIIVPVVEDLKKKGMNLLGPLPADTAFTKRSLEGVDAVLAMYHDQGLSVLKHAAFGDAINITLGLPVIRTSVDHGTAFELAGTGQADPDSLIAAVRTAINLVKAG